MPELDQTWVSLATAFPAGLDTETDPSQLNDGFTPDAYGMAIDGTGMLKKAAAIPTGTAAINITVSLSGSTWTWYYRRLWRASTTDLYFNSPEYIAQVAPQGITKISFAEDTGNIVTFLPALGGNMYVGKATGGYVLANADSLGGDFQHGNIVPSLKVAAAANAVEHEGIVYVSNGNGLMAWDGRQVAEITLPVRSIVSNFANKALTVDPQRGWIVGTSAFVYDTVRKRIFRYSGSSFRYTSKTLMDPRSRPFSVEALRFKYEASNGQSGQIRYQVRLDEDWGPVEVATLPYQQGAHNQEVVHLSQPLTAHKFSLRITDMDSNLSIRQIETAIDANWMSEGWTQ